MTKTIAIAGLLAGLVGLAALGTSATALEPLVHEDVRFDVPQTDLIPGVAAVRAACNLTASGEPLALRANESVRTILGVSPGPCAIVVVLFGVDVGLPGVTTTSLGRGSFFIPGIATATLGIVDMTVDLVTSLNSTTRIEDPSLASIQPQNLTWSSWSIASVEMRSTDAFGSTATSKLNTTFTYTMSLGLTVYALSVEVLHLDLTTIGTVAGQPSLRTDLTVDLVPHPLVLADGPDVRPDGATFSWGGPLDPDINHLELVLTDGELKASYELEPTASSASVPLAPGTDYIAWIVAVDGAGQGTPSNTVSFRTPASPPPTDPGTPLEAQGSSVVLWTLLIIAALLGIVGYSLGRLHGRRRD